MELSNYCHIFSIQKVYSIIWGQRVILKALFNNSIWGQLPFFIKYFLQARVNNVNTNWKMVQHSEAFLLAHNKYLDTKLTIWPAYCLHWLLTANNMLSISLWKKQKSCCTKKDIEGKNYNIWLKGHTLCFRLIRSNYILYIYRYQTH